MLGRRAFALVGPISLAVLAAGCGQGASAAPATADVSAATRTPTSSTSAGQTPAASTATPAPSDGSSPEPSAGTQGSVVTPNGTVVPLPELPGGPRARARVVALANGAALVIGGLTANGATAQVLYYDPQKARFIEIAPLAHARYRHEATLLPGPDGVLGTQDDWILVTGGTDGQNILDSVELIRLDPQGDPARATTIELPPLPAPRADHRAVLVPLGSGPGGKPWLGGSGVLVTGGLVPVPGGNVATSSAVVYRAELDAQGRLSGRAVHVSQPRVARYDHTATLIAGPDGVLGTDDDRVLVFGGIGSDPDDPSSASDALGPIAAGEVYEPALDRWSTLRTNGDAPVAAGPRRGHRAAHTASGGVVIVGGQDAVSGIRDSLLVDLDPRDAGLATLATGASLARARTDPEIAELDDGRILVAGGIDPATLAMLGDVEVLASDGRSVAPPFSMGGARVEHGLAALGQRVLVVGGIADPWTYSRPTAALLLLKH